MPDLSQAKPFNPSLHFSEVHAHKLYRYLQRGIYYDAQGSPIGVQPKNPAVAAGVRKLNAGSKMNKAAGQLKLPSEVKVGAVPDAVIEVRKENAEAAAAEDLLA